MRMRGSENDDRELGLFWSGINSIGQRVDRLIRRLETPAPDYRKRIEPHIRCSKPSGNYTENTDATAMLMALDGMAIDASLSALRSLERLERDNDGIDPAVIRTFSDQMATATEGYIALATDVLELDNPLDDTRDDRAPVWAGNLERRFMNIVEAAESMLPERLRRAERH